MSKKKKMTILVILLLLLLMNFNKSLAEAGMQTSSDKKTIEKGEEVNISVQIMDKSIASLTLELYWDNDRLELVKGPENSNYANNKILYTWVSNNGRNSDSIKIENFIFKGKENGIANIVAFCEAYNSNGEKVEIDTSNVEVQIGKEETEIMPIVVEEENVATDNANLKVLRLEYEGISPEFRKDVKEYYFVANNLINDIDITAIPENSKATVTITGNKDLKYGKNTISIKVESADKSKTETYYIYLTKTANIEAANANLETLAVRQGTLNPEFYANITKYKMEIANDIDRLDVLAIPQKEKATVEISGNGEMKIGDNKIEINVLAEDRITNKKYEITVHRRNVEEEAINQQEIENQTERLSVILEEEAVADKQQESRNEPAKERRSNPIFIISIVIIIAAVVIGGIAFYKFALINRMQ